MLALRLLLKALLLMWGLFPLALVAEPPGNPAISVHARSDGGWKLHYHFREPVRAIRFADAAGFVREDTWYIQTPGYRFDRDGDSQILVLVEDGQATNDITILLPTDTRGVPLGQDLFNLFTDTSAALFTRHFYVSVFDPTGAGKRRGKVIADIEITPGENQHVVILGTKSNGPMRWNDPNTRGTYAYVGTLEPDVRDQVVMIMDPGLPTWVENIARQTIPVLIDIYTQRLGRPLEAKPLILFSYEPEGAMGYSFNGGAIDGLLQIRIRGIDWETESAEMALRLTRFIAHELAQLWSGQLALAESKSPA